MAKRAKFIGIIIAFFFLTGCGRKSPPVPPGTLRPMPPSDLRFTITKDGVSLSWEIPVRNTDGSPIFGLKGFEILKASSSSSSSSSHASCASCDAVFSAPIWVPFSGHLTQGERMTYEDYTLKKGIRYIYKVRTVKGLFSKSIYSEPVEFIWYPPLSAITGLTYTKKEDFVILSWNGPAYFSDGAPVMEDELSHISYTVLMRNRVAQGEKAGRWETVKDNLKKDELRLNIKGLKDKKEGAMPINPIKNHEVIFKVFPVFHIGKQEIRGEASEVIAYPDKEPSPPPPKGLIAIKNEDYIELYWDYPELSANIGFWVFRKGPSDIIFRLNSSLIKDTVFKDITLLPAGKYVYWVEAVWVKSGLDRAIESGSALHSISNRVTIEIE